jgi:hypothetical protein
MASSGGQGIRLAKVKGDIWDPGPYIQVYFPGLVRDSPLSDARFFGFCLNYTFR